MLKRFAKRALADKVDLERRARELADQHGFPYPSSVRWVDNQHARWGSCTPVDGCARRAPYPASGVPTGGVMSDLATPAVSLACAFAGNAMQTTISRLAM